MGAAAKKSKPLTRLELCRELLEIERDNAPIFARMDEIKTLLKLQSETDGKFRETFANLGYVSVSPPTLERVTGEAPVVAVDAWQALKQNRRDKLLEEGLVKIEPIIKGAYHGQVRVNLHAAPQGASK